MEHQFKPFSVYVRDPDDNAHWDSGKLVNGKPVGDYVNCVMNHLRTIKSTPPGNQFFAKLTEANNNVTITYSNGSTNTSGPSLKACKWLRKCFINQDQAPASLELKKALDNAAIPRNGGNDQVWFCEQLLSTPVYHWDPQQNGFNGHPFNPQGYQPLTSQFTQLRTGLMATVDRWKDGAEPVASTPSAAGSAETDPLKADLVLLVLERFLTNGPGGKSVIRYDPLKTETSYPRPPEVGLFHELIHAFYNSQGAQLSPQRSDSETGGRYFELMAVGLEPFQDRPFSENKIRPYFNCQHRPKY